MSLPSLSNLHYRMTVVHSGFTLIDKQCCLWKRWSPWISSIPIINKRQCEHPDGVTAGEGLQSGLTTPLPNKTFPHDLNSYTPLGSGSTLQQNQLSCHQFGSMFWILFLYALSSPLYLLLRMVQHQVPLSCCATFGSFSSHLDLSALIH